MIHKEDLDSMLHDWLDSFKGAIALHNGEAMCETSRMVISICSILWAYYPEVFTKEVSETAETLFKDAVSCIRDDREKGEERDGYYDLYERNISERLEDLQGLKERSPIV